MNSRSASAAPASAASTRPAPIAPRRVGVRCHSAAAPPVASTVAAAGIAPAVGHDARCSAPRPPRAGARSCARARRSARAPVTSSDSARRHVPAGRAAAGVHDAPAGVPALERQQQLAARVAVELDPALLELAHPLRRLLAEDARGGGAGGTPACARACPPGARSGLSSRLERGREAALRPVARGLGERRARHELHARATLRRDQRGVEAGRAGADDGDVDLPGAIGCRVRHGGSTGTPPCPKRSTSTIPSSLEHDTGDHPERADRIRAIERGARGARLARLRARSRRRPSSGPRSRRCIRREYVDAIARCQRAGRRHARRGHGRVRRIVRGRAARGGRRGARRGRASDGRGRGPRSAGCARPATTPSRRARWASACSTTSPSRRGTRSTVTVVERVLVLDWDVHHGNGTNDIFYDIRARSCTRASTSRRCIRAPVRCRRAAPATGEGYTVNLPVPPGLGPRRVARRWSQHVVVPVGPRVCARAACSCRPASTPTATIRSRTAC